MLLKYQQSWYALALLSIDLGETSTTKLHQLGNQRRRSNVPGPYQVRDGAVSVTRSAEGSSHLQTSTRVLSSRRKVVVTHVVASEGAKADHDRDDDRA